MNAGNCVISVITNRLCYNSCCNQKDFVYKLPCYVNIMSLCIPRNNGSRFRLFLSITDSLFTNYRQVKWWQIYSQKLCLSSCAVLG